jgi:hypothetical protein
VYLIIRSMQYNALPDPESDKFEEHGQLKIVDSCGSVSQIISVRTHPYGHIRLGITVRGVSYRCEIVERQVELNERSQPREV